MLHVKCFVSPTYDKALRLLKRYLKRAALTPPTKTMATFVEDFPRPFKVDDVKEFYRADGGRSQLWSIRPEGAHSAPRATDALPSLAREEWDSQ